MIHLRSLRVVPPEGRKEHFPFTIPALRGVHELEFTTPVTLLVGENGSGKSTLLEGIARAADLITAGSQGAARDPTLDHLREFARALRLTWHARTKSGFFLRAEDFFGYVKMLREERASLEKELAEVMREFAHRSEHARGLAVGPIRSELHQLATRYGRELDTFSHGESFLAFFQSRFRPRGLYLLDEPEAPLSPQRQLAFLSMVKSGVEAEAQFVIATHSPLLLAFPGATLRSFDHPGLPVVEYAALEQVQLVRDFLNEPGRFLRHL